MDVFYLWVVFANGKVKRGEKKDLRWFAWEEKKVEGAGLAVLVVWAAAVMTLSKTVLYCKSHLLRRGNVCMCLCVANYWGQRRAQRGVFGIRQHWTQQPGEADLVVDHPQRCLDRASGVYDKCGRERDLGCAGRGRSEEKQMKKDILYLTLYLTEHAFRGSWSGITAAARYVNDE